MQVAAGQLGREVLRVGRAAAVAAEVDACRRARRHAIIASAAAATARAHARSSRARARADVAQRRRAPARSSGPRSRSRRFARCVAPRGSRAGAARRGSRDCQVAVDRVLPVRQARAGDVLEAAGCSSTEYAGRGAGRASVARGRALERHVGARAPHDRDAASSYHVQSPELVRWYVPDCAGLGERAPAPARGRASRSASRAGRPPPCSGSPARALRRIVSTKLRPPGP